MGKRNKKLGDQSIRLDFIRGECARSLLTIWRQGNDYYASVPGNQFHRSLHESGQVHTTGPGAKDHSDVALRTPISAFEGLEELYQFSLLNERKWIDVDAFKTPNKRPFDLIIDIDTLKIDEGKPIVVLVGVVSSETHLEDRIKSLCSGGAHTVVRTDFLPREDGPALYALVLVGTGAKRTHKQHPDDTIFLPQPGWAAASAGPARDGSTLHLFDIHARLRDVRKFYLGDESRPFVSFIGEKPWQVSLYFSAKYSWRR